MTYLEAFELKEPPFAKEIADADLWLPTSRQAVADGLLDALTEPASVMLVGEPGVGKTYSHNATLGRRDFYRQLGLALGLAPAATAGTCRTERRDRRDPPPVRPQRRRRPSGRRGCRRHQLTEPRV